MSQAPLVEQFTEEINAVITRYCGMDLTVAEALGALMLVQDKIIRDAREDDDE